MPFTIAPETPGREKFEALDADRQAAAVSISALCRRADVSEATYHRLRRDWQRTPNFRTLNKLRSALTQFGAGT